jgi:hypothetical protein
MLSRLASPIGELSNEFIKPKKPPKPEKSTILLSYKEYCKNPFVLAKLKSPELKSVARSFKLPISGTKRVLYDKILDYFHKCSHAIKIQKVFRGYLLRLSLKLRGEGWKNRKCCVNDSDFFSLEPLEEIYQEHFVSFQIGNFIYGCNIISLIHLMKTKTVIKNPYNRENIPIEVIKGILRLYGLIRAIHGLPVDAPVISNYAVIHRQEIVQDNQRIIVSTPTPTSGLPEGFIEELREKLRTIRAKPMATRIQELFMEIDLLGNYTHPDWFSSLGVREYIRLFRTLYEIWTIRGGLTRQIKDAICVLYDPFIEIRRQHIYFHDTTLEVACESCLQVMESMVYCGVDTEYKKIGALHVLTGLTAVSIGARTSLPWLYESIF